MIGVYKIINKINGKFYIGSSNDIEKRWDEHKRDLKNYKHHSIHLQRAWNKYGEENFEFQIIELINSMNDTKFQFEREQHFLDELAPYERTIGYNISRKAQGACCIGSDNHFFGKHHTSESKEKISNNRKYTTGENHISSKFTNMQVENLKLEFICGASIKFLMYKYQINDSVIYKIFNGQSYPEVRKDLNEVIKYIQRSKYILKNIIWNLYNCDIPYSEIEQILNISKKTVINAVYEKRKIFK